MRRAIVAAVVLVLVAGVTAVIVTWHAAGGAQDVRSFVVLGQDVRIRIDGEDATLERRSPDGGFEENGKASLPVSSAYALFLASSSERVGGVAIVPADATAAVVHGTASTMSPVRSCGSRMCVSFSTRPSGRTVLRVRWRHATTSIALRLGSPGSGSLVTGRLDEGHA
ncbi:MAG: hypothetical protein U0P45_11155 [Acidimicrobiales bacterium]